MTYTSMVRKQIHIHSSKIIFGQWGTIDTILRIHVRGDMCQWTTSWANHCLFSFQQKKEVLGKESTGIVYLHLPINRHSLKMLRFVILYIFVFIGVFLNAQLPSTNVYVAQLRSSGAEPIISNVEYVSDFNAGGYTNQPKFFDYENIYVSVASSSDTITDIYQLKINSHEYWRITETEDISEFSPAPVPNSENFSVVRIEQDGVSQSLWIYPLNRSNQGQRLLKKLNTIGYHTWLNSKKVALFLVGKINTLAIADITNDDVQIITENIGRCIKTKDENTVVFVHKIRRIFWLLKSYDIREKAITTICQMPKDREDFEILANGTFIVGNGSKISFFNPEKSTQWVDIADFTAIGINNITRLAVARDRLAFVNVKLKLE